uniref:Uncharacterized protein n=1 Tax=Anguilla anguilla TaxID=7936 RepID=A0A0E9S615_ANGAN
MFVGSPSAAPAFRAVSYELAGDGRRFRGKL